MPEGPRGEKRRADANGNAIKLALNGVLGIAGVCVYIGVRNWMRSSGQFQANDPLQWLLPLACGALVVAIGVAILKRRGGA